MAARRSKFQKKPFNIDLESLLISDGSQDGYNDEKAFEIHSIPQTKKSKVSNNDSNKKYKENITNTKIDNISKFDEESKDEVSTFFENFGNDFNKCLGAKKARLEQFTEGVISISQGRIDQLIKKQEEEVDSFKKKAVEHILKELDKFQDELKTLTIMESKLLKILEQQMKIIQKTSTTQSNWIEKFSNLHANFIQDYEKLKNKHKNEVMDMKKMLTGELSSLQSKFLVEAKKEEMITIQKYLRSVYF